jgi:hypothetical protein
MGRHRRAVGDRVDLGDRAPGDRGQQLVIGGPERIGRVIEAGDDRLEGDRVQAPGLQRGGDRRSEDGLPDSGVGAGYEAAARYAALAS